MYIQHHNLVDLVVIEQLNILQSDLESEPNACSRKKKLISKIKRSFQSPDPRICGRRKGERRKGGNRGDGGRKEG